MVNLYGKIKYACIVKCSEQKQLGVVFAEAKPPKARSGPSQAGATTARNYATAAEYNKPLLKGLVTLLLKTKYACIVKWI